MYTEFREEYDYSDDTLSRINETLDKIKEINEKGTNDKFNDYVKKLTDFIIKIYDYKILIQELDNVELEMVLKSNNDLYKDILNDNYHDNYFDPDYCCMQFGKDLGQILSYVMSLSRGNIEWVLNENYYLASKTNELIISICDILNRIDDVSAENIIGLIRTYQRATLAYRVELGICKGYVPEANEKYAVIIQNSSLAGDNKELLQYERYIGENEIKMCNFINSLSNDKIDLIADTFVMGFKNGYARDGKDISKKSIVRIMYSIGQERLIKKIIDKFESIGMKEFVFSPAPVSHFNQYEYDHEFNIALYFDKEYAEANLDLFEKICEKYKDIMIQYAGPAVLENFGEIPFSPISKENDVRLSEEQNDLYRDFENKRLQITNTYSPRAEYSFTIMALPNTEIGNKFEEIFDETCKVNTLDSDKYEKLHKHIIDSLDQADYVWVKGKDNNKTDIKVKMQELINSEKETLFENCVANVNIPVGEVFTSPKLAGTTGVLNVSKVFLNGYMFKNLTIYFKDGYTADYNCSNFNNEEQNKKYISENLLHPHKTLPIGEFAIGTNTTAYVMARKYDILSLLPILIVEKMGPHFAIGDTCFSRREDLKVFNNLDGKEVIARDNERSILRKTNIKDAYTNKHTDITIPYDEIEFIKVVTKEGKEISIIEDGRFVVPGTEELNEVFEQNVVRS